MNPSFSSCQKSATFLVPLFIFTLATAFTSNGQDARSNDPTDTQTHRNELVVNLFAMVSYDHATPNPMPDGVRKAFANGVMFKRHFDHDAVRVGFDLFRDTYNTVGPRINSSLESSTYRADLRLGMQRTLTASKVKPFVGVDLVYSFERTRGETTFGWGEWTSSGYGNYRIDRNRIGLSLIAGITYRPIDKFSITAESSFLIAYSHKKESSTTVFDVQGTHNSASTINAIRVFGDPLRSLAVSLYF